MSNHDQTDQGDLGQEIEQIAQRLDVPIDVLRPVSREEIQYLLDRWPFLQIVGPEMRSGKEAMKIVRSDSGWDIHDYGDAMSSSPGRLLFGGGNFRVLLEGEEDEEGEGGSGGGLMDIVNPGKGTLINQTVMTAFDMVQMASERGWRAVKIVDGHPRMKRAAWIQAGKLGVAVDGFEPTPEDERIRALVTESADDWQARQARASVRRGLGR